MKLRREKEAEAVSSQSLAEIAVEAWRLTQAVERVVTRMDPMDAERFMGQYRWFLKKVEAALGQSGMQMVDLTGQPYSVGMAATPLNADEFDDEALEVAQMVEPIIMQSGKVIKTGSMLLGPRTR